jgi:hypothetical protein
LYYKSFTAIIIITCFYVASVSAQVAPFKPSSRFLDTVFGKADKNAFADPPKVFYPETWFHFISENISKKGITADLEAIAGAGISGITLFHGQSGNELWPGVDTPVKILTTKWFETVQFAALECERLGLKFSMENCPGWAMAGGPWIKPSEAMRDLVWSRTDILQGGKTIKMQLRMPQPSDEPWRDYKSIAVLAFPKPLDDNDDILKVASVKSVNKSWGDLLTNTTVAPVSLAPSGNGNANSFEVTFVTPVIIRNIQLPAMNHFNSAWVYELGVKVKLEARLPDGSYEEIINENLPEGNWQDNDMSFTLACSKDIKAATYRISFITKHEINVDFIHFSTAARENNWETEAAWTLRSVGNSNRKYEQNKKTYINPAQVLDITSYVNAQGELEWEAPAGDWTILRIGNINAGKKNGPAPPEGTGWECDKLSVKGANAHFAGYIGHLSGDNGPLKGGLLTSMTMDSWEAGAQTWTGDMEAEFQSREGYGLRKWMPALLGYVVKDQETTFRFLHDWKSVVNDLFVNDFYGRMSALARQNNLSVTYETAAGDIFPGDIMEYYKYADVPMCEFWQPMTSSFVGSLNFKPIKPTTSAAHIYGKPRVAAEAFTNISLSWDEQWQMLKEVANINMVEGVTHLVYHTYTHNPQTNFLPPGTSFGGGIGTPFLRGETWWKHMPYLNAYFARCSYLLERGKPVSDVLWYLGDEIDHKPDQNAPFPAGYKYDYCNPDVLLNRLSVKNGLITTPEGITYKVLWLPKTTHMLPQTLEKINKLLNEGAVVVGNPPKDLGTLSGGASVQLRFNKAVKNIWASGELLGSHKVGKGTIISGLSLQASLNQLKIMPDVSGDTALWVHRKVQGADWYFVTSPKGKAFNGTLSFRTTGGAELWDPVTGKIESLVSEEKNGRSLVSFNLPQAGSCFVVFHHNEKVAAPMLTKVISESQISHDWMLEFPDGWGVPQPVKLNELKAWKDLDISAEGKAFSGTATYTTTFDAGDYKAGNNFILNLGKVAMIAKIIVNGKDMGTVWAEPYQVDITKAIVPGKNTLKVEVTSTWFNRLVYDAGRPENKRKTWTIDGPGKDNPLRVSGLLGPVTILTEENNKL